MTGWPSVNILRQDKKTCLICNSYLRMAARQIVFAVPFLKYTLPVAWNVSNHKKQAKQNKQEIMYKKNVHFLA